MVPDLRGRSVGSCVFRLAVPRGDDVGEAGVVRRRAGMLGIGHPANGLFPGEPPASPLPGRVGSGKLWTRLGVVVNPACWLLADIVVTLAGKSLALFGCRGRLPFSLGGTGGKAVVRFTGSLTLRP
jgi:hypothetical protein